MLTTLFYLEWVLELWSTLHVLIVRGLLIVTTVLWMQWWGKWLFWKEQKRSNRDTSHSQCLLYCPFVIVYKHWTILQMQFPLAHWRILTIILCIKSHYRLAIPHLKMAIKRGIYLHWATLTNSKSHSTHWRIRIIGQLKNSQEKAYRWRGVFAAWKM